MYVMCVNVCTFVTGFLPHRIMRADQAASIIKLLSTGQAMEQPGQAGTHKE